MNDGRRVPPLVLGPKPERSVFVSRSDNRMSAPSQVRYSQISKYLVLQKIPYRGCFAVPGDALVLALRNPAHRR